MAGKNPTPGGQPHDRQFLAMLERLEDALTALPGRLGQILAGGAGGGMSAAQNVSDATFAGNRQALGSASAQALSNLGRSRNPFAAAAAHAQSAANAAGAAAQQQRQAAVNAVMAARQAAAKARKAQFNAGGAAYTARQNPTPQNRAAANRAAKIARNATRGAARMTAAARVARSASKNSGQAAKAATARAAKASSMARTAGTTFAAGSVVGQVAMTVTDLGKAGVAAAKGLRDFAEGTNAANKYLGRYNAAIDGAMRQLDFGEFRRNIALGNRSLQTAVELAKNIDRMRDSFAGFDAVRANVANKAASFGAGVNEEFGNALSNITRSLQDVAEELAGGRKIDPAAAGKGVVHGLANALLGPGIAGPLFQPAAPPPPAAMPWHEAFALASKGFPLRAARAVPKP